MIIASRLTRILLILAIALSISSVDVLKVLQVSLCEVGFTHKDGDGPDANASLILYLH